MLDTKTNTHRNMKSTRPAKSTYPDTNFRIFENKISSLIYNDLEDNEHYSFLPKKKDLFFKFEYTQDELLRPQTVLIKIFAYKPTAEIEILESSDTTEILCSYEILLTENAFYQYKKTKLKTRVLSSYYLFQKSRHDLLFLTKSFMQNIIIKISEMIDPKKDLLLNWLKDHMNSDGQLPLNALFREKIPFSKATATLFSFVFGLKFKSDEIDFLTECNIIDIFIPTKKLVKQKELHLACEHPILTESGLTIQCSRITYENSRVEYGQKDHLFFFQEWVNDIAYIQINIDALKSFIAKTFIGTYHFLDICAEESILNQTLLELLDDMDTQEILESLELESISLLYISLKQITENPQIYIKRLEPNDDQESSSTFSTTKGNDHA